MRSALSTAAAAAMGSCDVCGGTIGTSGPISPAMSSGSSRCTGPGLSSVATRNASRTMVGMLEVLTIWRENLVSGFIVATMSTIWKRACWLLRIGFCPVTRIIGIAPRWA